jgi:hypothetical protein
MWIWRSAFANMAELVFAESVEPTSSAQPVHRHLRRVPPWRCGMGHVVLHLGGNTARNDLPLIDCLRRAESCPTRLKAGMRPLPLLPGSTTAVYRFWNIVDAFRASGVPLTMRSRSFRAIKSNVLR